MSDLSTPTTPPARYIVIPEDRYNTAIAEMASSFHHGGFITRRELGNPLPITLTDISDLAKRCHANSAQWFPHNHTDERLAVTHCTLGLAGEAGEVANKVKKLYGYTVEQQPAELRQAVIEELVDTLIYDLVLLDLLGADIPAAIEAVVAKCVARWGPEAGRAAVLGEAENESETSSE